MRAWPLWLSLISCTPAGLQPFAGQETTVDNKLDINGQFCTSQPDEVSFPVKLMIVIDQSASLQCTDPANARLSALAQVGSTLDSLPNVEFAVVGFASWARITEFTTDWNTASDALAPANGSGGPATDYQGSLATALAVLEQDMLQSGPAENARSRYVVLFLSDGVPEPRCRAGCDDGDSQPDSLYGVCNTQQSIPDGDYVGITSPCPEYNQPSQITQKVSDIVSLAEFYGVGSLTFNTALLFADPEDVEAVCGDITAFGYIKDEAEPLLQDMAEAGGGTYRDINTSEDIDFLSFDYESLKAPYGMTEFFAVNMSMMPTENGPQNDSDQDGLTDELEFSLGLDRLSKDSDGDNFSDLIETLYFNNGFDAQDGTVPAWGCTDADDRDGDGLRACEESFLNTSPLVPDTDGDRIPDGLELRFGTDPTVNDSRVDHDLDGRTSEIEIRTGTHPLIYEENALLDQIRATVQPAEVQPPGGATCYDYSLQDVSLVSALSATAEKGINQIHLYAAEEPVGLSGGRSRFQVSCIESRYLGEGFKDPLDGLIEVVSSYRFVELADFDPLLHCMSLTEDPATRPPWSWEVP